MSGALIGPGEPWCLDVMEAIKENPLINPHDPEDEAVVFVDRALCAALREESYHTFNSLSTGASLLPREAGRVACPFCPFRTLPVRGRHGVQAVLAHMQNYHMPDITGETTLA